ncbi:MAG: hypothetical protein ABIO92_09560, partial [Chloroflexia bacterium]
VCSRCFEGKAPQGEEKKPRQTSQSAGAFYFVKTHILFGIKHGAPGKSQICHSERSEESLWGLGAKGTDSSLRSE